MTSLLYFRVVAFGLGQDSRIIGWCPNYNRMVLNNNNKMQHEYLHNSSSKYLE